jgi:hypothetical protein
MDNQTIKRLSDAEIISMIDKEIIPDSDHYDPRWVQALMQFREMLATNRWIPVTESLPDNLWGSLVLVFKAKGNMDVNFMLEDGEWCYEVQPDNPITHWRYLPVKPPKEAQG